MSQASHVLIGATRPCTGKVFTQALAFPPGPYQPNRHDIAPPIPLRHCYKDQLGLSRANTVIFGAVSRFAPIFPSTALDLHGRNVTVRKLCEVLADPSFPLILARPGSLAGNLGFSRTSFPFTYTLSYCDATRTDTHQIIEKDQFLLSKSGCEELDTIDARMIVEFITQDSVDTLNETDILLSQKRGIISFSPMRRE